MVVEADQAQQLVEPRPVHRRVRAGDDRGQSHVLLDGEHGNQVEELEHEADPPAPEERELVVAQGRQRRAVHHDLTRGGRVEAAHEMEQGGLPGSRRSHDGEEAPGGHVEGDAVERAPRVVFLDQIAHGDDGGAGGHPGSVRIVALGVVTLLGEPPSSGRMTSQFGPDTMTPLRYRPRLGVPLPSRHEAEKAHPSPAATAAPMTERQPE